MIRALRWVWAELTRPRGPVRHRFYRTGRGDKGGVALLLTMSAIMIMTILVTEIVHDASVRLQLAANHRDEAKAEALARSGINMYRLIIVASQQVGQVAESSGILSMASTFLGVNADSLVTLVPSINSTLMRLLFVSGGDLSDKESANFQEGGLSDAQIDKSREGGSIQKRNFLDFDGDFQTTVEIENKRIHVGSLSANNLAELSANPKFLQLQALMGGEDNEQFLRDNDLEKLELIGNLVDWIDLDDNRVYQGGSEMMLYDSLPSPYKPKNAAFDSPQEIRLVDGWQRDDVWDRFGKHLTMFGKGRTNVNAADREVLRAMVRAYLNPQPPDVITDQIVGSILTLRNTPPMMGGCLFKQASNSNAQKNQNDQQSAAMQAFLSSGMPSGTCGDFASFLAANAQYYGFQLNATTAQINAAVTTKSEVYRVISKSQVGDAKVTIEAVFDFSSGIAGGGQTIYWRRE